MSQKELAELAGITQPTLSEIETGETRRSFAPTIIAIAGALEANINWLQTGKGDPYDTSDHDKSELVQMVHELSPEQTALVKSLVRSVIANTAK
ncbi:MAG: helix-turn-helix transcriptional regulator [Zoogloeaceae bacterium]|nr:helix-turn-helix transcriptional regulator [Zoogloeaceae bacterium]